MIQKLLIRPELAADEELSAAKLFFNQSIIDTPAKLHTLPKYAQVVSRYSITPYVDEYFRNLKLFGLTPINTREQTDFCLKKQWATKLADLVGNQKPVEAYRVFVLGNRILCSGPLLQKTKLLTHEAAHFANSVISRIGNSCNFYAVDIAKCTNNFWIISSVQDGQLSGLSTVNPRKFYSLLYERMQKMEAERVLELVRMLNDSNIAHDISDVATCVLSEDVVLEAIERIQEYRKREPGVSIEFSAKHSELVFSKRVWTELGPTRSALRDPYGTIPF